MGRHTGLGALALGAAWLAVYVQNSFLAVLLAAVLVSYLMTRDGE